MTGLVCFLLVAIFASVAGDVCDDCRCYSTEKERTVVCEGGVGKRTSLLGVTRLFSHLPHFWSCSDLQGVREALLECDFTTEEMLSSCPLLKLTCIESWESVPAAWIRGTPVSSLSGPPKLESFEPTKTPFPTTPRALSTPSYLPTRLQASTSSRVGVVGSPTSTQGVRLAPPLPSPPPVSRPSTSRTEGPTSPLPSPEPPSSSPSYPRSTTSRRPTSSPIPPSTQTTSLVPPPSVFSRTTPSHTPLLPMSTLPVSSISPRPPFPSHISLPTLRGGFSHSSKDPRLASPTHSPFTRRPPFRPTLPPSTTPFSTPPISQPTFSPTEGALGFPPSTLWPKEERRLPPSTFPPLPPSTPLSLTLPTASSPLIPYSSSILSTVVQSSPPFIPSIPTSSSQSTSSVSPSLSEVSKARTLSPPLSTPSPPLLPSVVSHLPSSTPPASNASIIGNWPNTSSLQAPSFGEDVLSWVQTTLEENVTPIAAGAGVVGGLVGAFLLFKLVSYLLKRRSVKLGVGGGEEIELTGLSGLEGGGGGVEGEETGRMRRIPPPLLNLEELDETPETFLSPPPSYSTPSGLDPPSILQTPVEVHVSEMEEIKL